MSPHVAQVDITGCPREFPLDLCTSDATREPSRREPEPHSRHQPGGFLLVRGIVTCTISEISLLASFQSAWHQLSRSIAWHTQTQSRTVAEACAVALYHRLSRWLQRKFSDLPTGNNPALRLMIFGTDIPLVVKQRLKPRSFSRPIRCGTAPQRWICWLANPKLDIHWLPSEGAQSSLNHWPAVSGKTTTIQPKSGWADTRIY